MRTLGEEPCNGGISSLRVSSDKEDLVKKIAKFDDREQFYSTNAFVCLYPIRRVYEKMSNTKMSNCSTFFPFFVIEEKMSNRNFEKSTFFPFCSTFFPFFAIK